MARFAFAAWLPLREPVDRRQLEAAELSGLSPVRTWWRIVAPAWAASIACRAMVAVMQKYLLLYGRTLEKPAARPLRNAEPKLAPADSSQH